MGAKASPLYIPKLGNVLPNEVGKVGAVVMHSEMVDRIYCIFHEIVQQNSDLHLGTRTGNAANSPNQKCAAVLEVAIAIFASPLMESNDANM